MALSPRHRRFYHPRGKFTVIFFHRQIHLDADLSTRRGFGFPAEVDFPGQAGKAALNKDFGRTKASA